MHSHMHKASPPPHTHNVSTHTLSGLWEIFLKGTFVLLPLIFNSKDAIIVTESLQAPVPVLCACHAWSLMFIVSQKDGIMDSFHRCVSKAPSRPTISPTVALYISSFKLNPALSRA